MIRGIKGVGRMKMKPKKEAPSARRNEEASRFLLATEGLETRADWNTSSAMVRLLCECFRALYLHSRDEGMLTKPGFIRRGWGFVIRIVIRMMASRAF